MAVYFVDSSALLKRYRYETGSQRMEELLDDAERVVVARLVQIEISAALVRRGRVTGWPLQELSMTLSAFDHDLSESFDVVELNPPAFDLANLLARKYGLRAADALQLSCALIARKDAEESEFILLSSDMELNQAAIAEQLRVLDPATA